MAFTVPEKWYEPVQDHDDIKIIQHPPGSGYIHPASTVEVRCFLADLLPEIIPPELQIIQLSSITRKRDREPLYGMQWGCAVYLYPQGENLIEEYTVAPKPEHKQVTEKYGGHWHNRQNGKWTLIWKKIEQLRDFYLHNVLMHEIGHAHDNRNTTPRKREQFANAFAIEHGDRPYTQDKKKGRVHKRHHNI